jgi:hypothetical protein
MVAARLFALSLLSALTLASISPAVGWSGLAGIDKGRKPAAIPLGPTPAAVAAFCRYRARLHKFVVLCPTRYPRVRGSDVSASGTVFLGPSFYWASFNDDTGFAAGDHGHLILGGQRPPFSLVGSRGMTWPRPGQPRPVQQLPLPRLITTPKAGGGVYVDQNAARIRAHATVAGMPALVLLAPPYPDGGISGDHVIVIWNWHRHGYMVSLHFSVSPAGRPNPLAERIAAALAVARSFTPVAA